MTIRAVDPFGWVQFGRGAVEVFCIFVISMVLEAVLPLTIPPLMIFLIAMLFGVSLAILRNRQRYEYWPDKADMQAILMLLAILSIVNAVFGIFAMDDHSLFTVAMGISYIMTRIEGRSLAQKKVAK